jgi:hypothetical protein
MTTTGAGRPRASVPGAFVQGWRRVYRAPLATAGIVLAFAVLHGIGTVPLSATLRPVLTSEYWRPLPGWNGDWIGPAARLGGWQWILGHAALGFGGLMPIVRLFADRQPFIIATMAATDPLLWALLTGGLLDRLARDRRVDTADFSAASGVYFARFLRLGLLLGPVYWLLYRQVFPALLGLVPDTIDQGVVGTRGWIAAGCLGCLAVVSLIGDYAEVRAVVEDRRSMIGALAASLRFIGRRPIRALTLWILTAIPAILVLMAWSRVPLVLAPEALRVTFTVVPLLILVWVRMGFMATALVFFQGELAHAGYTAAPPYEWPDSPAAEAIENLVKRNALAQAPVTR